MTETDVFCNRYNKKQRSLLDIWYIEAEEAKLLSKLLFTEG